MMCSRLGLLAVLQLLLGICGCSRPPAATSITNSVGMEFTQIPAGEFSMGMPDRGEENPPDVPEHQVRITTPFYLGKYEITQRQYSTVMNSNPSWHQLSGGGEHEIDAVDTSSYPVEMVSWEDATEFCHRLSDLPEEQAAGRHYRLPTEAEWEYACRGGKSDPLEPENIPFPDITPQDQKPIVVKDVGSYSPNEFGLFDMRENVWEWCADWYSRDYYKQSPRDDPQGPASGLFRVVRGRAWVFTGNKLRYPRDPTPASHKCCFLGFRVVCYNK